MMEPPLPGLILPPVPPLPVAPVPFRPRCQSTWFRRRSRCRRRRSRQRYRRPECACGQATPFGRSKTRRRTHQARILAFLLALGQARPRTREKRGQRSGYQLRPLRTLTGSPVNGGTCARPRARITQPFTELSLNDWIKETLATLPDGEIICARPLCGPVSHVVADSSACHGLGDRRLVGTGGGRRWRGGHRTCSSWAPRHLVTALALGLGLA